MPAQVGFLVVFFLLFMSLSTKAAELPVMPEADYSSLAEVGTGSLLIKQAEGMYRPFLRSKARYEIEVNGLISNVTLRQEFINPSDEWVEAIYVFPLPGNSAVNNMRMVIGERVIEGVIEEREAAQRIYTQARREGKRAGLLEQQRPNLFTTRIANIAPGQTVMVEVSFLQTLSFENGEFSFSLPMTITPRYIPGKILSETSKSPVRGWAFATNEVPDAAQITPPQSHQVETDQLVASLKISVNSGFEIAKFSSPYHPIQVTRNGSSYLVSTSDNEIPMDRDFELRWRPVATSVPTAAFFSETVSNTEFGLLMLLPPLAPTELKMPPRRLILVIDSSGSMAGQSMQQAKQAVNLALQSLRPEDQFNVIDFDTGFQQLFEQSVSATAINKTKARQFVDSLVADGGTEMAAPLRQALAPLSKADDASFLTQIVFVTDGSVGNESSLLQLIQEEISSQRLYTVAIGSAPNAWFMRKAAEFGRGTFTRIGDTESVRSSMAELFSKIESPALTDITLEWGRDGSAAVEFYPGKVPDLFLGEPLVVNTQFKDKPDHLRIEGQFQGQPWSTQVQLSQGENSQGVATLWARAKVNHLQDEGIRNGNRSMYRETILQLGLQHNLVTPYTSFVAVEEIPSRPDTADWHAEQVANRMPAGSQQQAPAIGYPNTGLGLSGKFLVALLLLFVAIVVWISKYFKDVSNVKDTSNVEMA